MMRFPPIDDADFNDSQRAMATKAQRTGPFQALLRAPGLWEALQSVRLYLARQSLLSVGVREAAMLAIARHWDCSAAFSGHLALARTAQLNDDTLRAIGEGREPDIADPQIALAAGFCRTLLASHHIDDAQFESASATFGERGVIELIGLVGFFTTICLTLNTAGLKAESGFTVPDAA